MSALTARELHHLQQAAGHTCTNPACPCTGVAIALADTARTSTSLEDAALARVLLRLSAVLADAAERHDLTGQAAAWCLIRAAAELATLELEPTRA